MLFKIAFIFFCDLKFFFKRGGRILGAAMLAFAVCMAAGSAGTALIYGKSIFDPFSVAVVDQDNSYETNVLFTNLKDIQGLKGTVTFIRLSESDARKELNEGGIEAYIILPEGFASDFEYGVNTPPIIAAAGGLKSELVKMFVNSAIEQLSASQAGVYATLDAVTAYGGQALYDKAFQGINMTFISLFFSRELMLKTVSVSAAGTVPPGIFFIVSFFLFFCVLNTGFVSDCFCGAGCIRRLRNAGVPGWSILVSHMLSGMLLNFFLAASVIAALFMSGILSNTRINLTLYNGLVFFTVILALSAFSALWFALTGDRRVKGAAVFVFALLSLFFSGGLIPFSFLPSRMAAAGSLTFNYHAAAALSGFFTQNARESLPGILGYALAALLLALLLLRAKESA